MNFNGNFSSSLQQRQRYAAVVMQPPWANQPHCAASVSLDSTPDSFMGSLPVGSLSGFSAPSSCGSSVGRIHKGMVTTEDDIAISKTASAEMGFGDVPKSIPFGMPGTLGAQNGSRVVGTVGRWHGHFGFLHWHPYVGVKVKVYCPVAAIPTGHSKLAPKDVVEFTVFESPKGPRAEVVELILPVAPPLQLHLDNYSRPAEELEPSCDHAVDSEKCRRCLDEFLNYKRVPSRMRPMADEYFAVVDKFVAAREDRIGSDLGEKTSKGTPDQVQLAQANLAKAWHFIRDKSPPMTLDCLMEVHAMLGAASSSGPSGQLRARGAKMDDCRFCHHTEVPAALERYIDGLKLLLAREDLSSIAKSAWAGYNILAFHPFAAGNGRLARLLVNWVLRQCGLPFFIVLCGSEELRGTWREAIAHGHTGMTNGQPSQPLASIISVAVAKCWTEIEQEADRAARSREEVAEDRAARMCRERAQEGSCSICLDGDPNTMVLCCGVAYHFSCLTRWLSTAPEPVCPTCRAAIPSPPLQQQRGRHEVRVMEVGFPFDFRPDPDLLRELDRRWEEVLGGFRQRAGAVITARTAPGPGLGLEIQALCTFCPNQRAMNCTLDACARCCTSTQRRYGLRCIRHPVRPSSADGERRPRADSLRSDSDSIDEPEAAANNMCIFCDNRRAVDCAAFACRSCCLSRGQPCPRHSPSGPSSTSATNFNTSSGSGGSASSSAPPNVSIRSGEVHLQQTPPPPDHGMPRSRSGICSFCSNRAAMECIMHACRSCCTQRGGPCSWHRSNFATNREGEVSEDFFPPVPSDLFTTAVMNAGNSLSQASSSSSAAATRSADYHLGSQRLDGIPQTHLSDEASSWGVRGLPLSSSTRLDPRSPVIVLNDDIATRCRFCSNSMAAGCIHQACRRCCMNQGDACPRHF